MCYNISALNIQNIKTADEVAKLNEYGKFVTSTTSEESLHTEALVDRLMDLHVHHAVEFSQLLTASIGMQAESGEFSEIIKKIVFQGKEFTKEE